MKIETLKITNNIIPRHGISGMSHMGMVLAQALLLGLGSVLASGQDDGSGFDDQGAQVLTRGPVHEAFAGIVSYNSEPGIIVDRAPPAVIEELPPSQRPEGDNINWIPGYWSWDDERSEHLWVSGTWRALPPGRQWNTGYWGQTGQGYQWTSGYWGDASVRDTTYLPRPPVTVEVGPNVAAPSRDHVWSPGSWAWQQERYAWRPGYWEEGRSNWDWTPAHYVWTPRGHVYVDGYWDYSMDRRGVLYAPVRFQAGYHSRPGFQYAPVIAIGIAALVDNLFLRPKYHHYYFGDYYDRGYTARGYYSPHVFQSRRYGYDPVYSYQRWSHRQDNDWERRQVASYDYRRDHEASRPPRTWSDQRRMKMDSIDAKDRQQYQMASSFDDMAKQPDRTMRFQSVSANERKKIADQGYEVRKIRDQRREIESQGMKVSGGKAERDIKPTKARHPASPIVGRSRDQFSELQAPPKPRGGRDDNKKEQADRKQGQDKDRSDLKKEQPTSRDKTESKAKERKTNPSQEKTSRPTPKNESPPTRREEKPETKERERNAINDKSRLDKKIVPDSSRRDNNTKTKEPERKTPDTTDRRNTNKESSAPRRDGDAKTRNPDTNTKQESNRKEENIPGKDRAKNKKIESDDLKKKSSEPATGKKPESDKDQSKLTDEEEREKE